MQTLSIDIEAYSGNDLISCGVYKYAEADDFEILLFGYSQDHGPVQVVDLASGEKIPKDVLDALTDPSVRKWAFNANFERICLSRYLRDLGRLEERYLSPEGWYCTMIWSAYLGLPLSLAGAGAALGLDRQKMAEGKELIRLFCRPCNPTRANGGRVRNRPEHDPVKWKTFLEYNRRDVEVEASIQEKLRNYPVPDDVWDQYHMDQEINDRGIKLDMELVTHAIRMDEESKQQLSEQIRSLTGLENPNSVQQMKAWLADQGLEADTLGKKAVAGLLETCSPELQTVLRLRQQLSKSSVKKYTAMQNAVCSDGRARGMLQFYGANRTGRFSGKLIQLQNLPQNHLQDLDAARNLVKSGDFEMLRLL
ncbi:MAG: hypothetical protein IJI38_07100, partial [Clostridia bacterium]|nr:hypothetical protein [Clostridia bacterium]